MTTEFPKILILVGAARSGSTLAGMMLGQTGHFVYAGELNHFWDRGLGLNHLCGCGKHFADCESWQSLVASINLENVDGLARYEAMQHLLADKHSINPFRVRLPAPVHSEEYIYSDIRKLYSELARRKERRWILDGAKQPIYARLLIDIFGPQSVHVIHLVRDPRGVAHSAAKKRAKTDTGRRGDEMMRRNPHQSALNWIKLDLSAHALRKEAASYRLIRYEDLCTHGPALIDDLMIKIGLQPDSEQAATADTNTIHTISGNPIRMRGMPRTVIVDDAWRTEMPLKDKLVVTALCLPWLHRYGYPFL